MIAVARACLLATALACSGDLEKDAPPPLETGDPPVTDTGPGPTDTDPPTGCEPGVFGSSTFGDACFQ